MKTFKIIALSILFTQNISAQTLESARKKTENEQFEVAGKEFASLIAKEPTRSDYYFYYGENFIEKGDLDSATIIWNNGAKIDPLSALIQVGLGKSLWFKGDTTAANVNITKALTSTKNKNAEILRQIAVIYLKAPKYKKLDAAVVLLDKAIKLDATNPENFLIKGDVLLEKTPNEGSPAIKNYNLALGLNPKSPKAIIRTGKLYQRSGADSLAAVKYKDAQLLDPTFAPAYRENAELNMKMGQYSKAIENWKKYLALNNSISARYRYSASLFTGKKYCEVITELLYLKANGMDNFYIERMLATSYCECTENDVKASYVKGLEASKKFFEIAPKEKVLASDYKFKGLLLSKSGSDSLAIIEYTNVINTDPSKSAEMYTEIAKLYMKNKATYPQAIVTLEKKRNNKFSNLTLIEVNDLATAYYYGEKNYAMADSCYTNLTVRSPKYALGYLGLGKSIWRADVKGDKWLAKDAFTKYLELLTPEEKANAANKSKLIESSKYLAEYYLRSPEKDKVKAKAYYETVLALDPNDAQAKAFFAGPDSK